MLPQDTLVLLRMDGTEEMSGDFEWRVEALSSSSDVDLHALLGTHATVEIDHADGTRAFDGIVTEASLQGVDETGWRYDLVLRPWLHVASLRRNMRIFHDKTVVEIVEEVLSAYAGLGKPHLDVLVSGDYPILEYTVQYGESDADFVRRQLERHGISWSWRHEAGSHTLILTDTVASLPEIPGTSRPFYRIAGFHQHEEEHFRAWSSGERITTGAVRLTEYNFKIPAAAQEVEQAGDASHPEGDIESYDWPGDYLEQPEGQGVVDRRAQEERGQAPRHRAEGDVVCLGAGWRVTLGGDEVPNATGRCFVCLKATHRFRAQSYGTGDAGGDDQPYDGAYVLTPDDTPYRPERRTTGPRVQGPETAVVVGEGEIDCDEHGRILCRFHWDLAGAHTMRVRVSQNWASKGWGGMVIPRIGMEVIVEHLRGDPDKPIVTGCVYNGKNTPPYELPGNKTKSTFRSQTHPAPQSIRGFNEFTFEDASGREEVFLRASRDFTTKVDQHATRRVDQHDVLSVGGFSLSETEKSKTENVGSNYSINVGTGAGGLLVGGDHRNDRFGIRPAAYTVGLTPTAGNAGSYSVSARGAIQFDTSASMSFDIAHDARTRTGKSHVTNVGENHRLSVSGNSKETVGKRKVIDVHEEILIRCGKAELRMKADGSIELNGKRLDVDQSEATKIKSGRIDLN